MPSRAGMFRCVRRERPYARGGRSLLESEDDGRADPDRLCVDAGLADALNGTEQYTVFAPTDAAFVTTLGVVDEAVAIAAVNGET
jgi:fasciclin domain-containing protein